MSSTRGPVLDGIRARLRAYSSRRYAFLLGLAVLHLGLMVAAGWLVAVQIGANPIRVLVIGLLGAVAAFVIASPGSAGALVFIVGCGFFYLMLTALETSIGADDRMPHPFQVLGLAAALFLVHALDGLREILPPNASIDPTVLTRWLRRVAEALVPGLGIGGLLVVLPTASGGGTFWLVGAVALLLAVGLPVLVLRPRPWAGPDDPTS